MLDCERGYKHLLLKLMLDEYRTCKREIRNIKCAKKNNKAKKNNILDEKVLCISK